MSASASRLVNPRLGAYFGIVASLFVAQFVLALIMVELGSDARLLQFVCLLFPFLMYVGLGLASTTVSPNEFWAAGRRVPAVYNGGVIGMVAAGGIFAVAVTGLFFTDGFDAWALVLGGIGGLVIAGVLIAPYFRKFGSYTVPSFLGRRLQSQAVRLTAAAVLIVPTFLVLIAELSLATWLARQLTGSNERWMLTALVVTSGTALLAGGMRGATWSGTAQLIATMLAVLVGVGVAGLWYTFLPIPQLSHGPILQQVTSAETAFGVPAVAQPTFAWDYATNSFEPIDRQIAEAFTSIGPGSFVLVMITMMAGLSAAPWLLPRFSTTPSVHTARKSLSWAVLFFGLLMLTLSAGSVFLRSAFMTDVVGRAASDLPAWFSQLQGMGFAAYSSNLPQLPPSAIQVHRDSTVFALPVVLGFTPILIYLAFAGALAASLAAISATTMAISSILTEDVAVGFRWEPFSPTLRLAVARLVIVGTLLLAAFVVTATRTDPLVQLLWAMSLSAATSFPLVILTIWYKRLTPIAALLALVIGFSVAVVLIFFAELLALPVLIVGAGPSGLIAASFTALLVSQFSGRPARVAIQHVRDMRIPGGETIYDREIRLMRLRENATGS